MDDDLDILTRFTTDYGFFSHVEVEFIKGEQSYKLHSQFDSEGDEFTYTTFIDDPTHIEYWQLKSVPEFDELKFFPFSDNVYHSIVDIHCREYWKGLIALGWKRGN
jgi:hypothetical protein